MVLVNPIAGVGDGLDALRKSACKEEGQLQLAGQIPFRCLVAEAPANLVYGSGNGASTEPRGVLRGQLGCMVIGQASGVAAALATRSGAPVDAVGLRALPAALFAQGVALG